VTRQEPAAAKRVLLSTIKALAEFHPKHWDARKLVSVQKERRPAPVEPSAEHLRKAIAWIKRAQDVFPDGGVSWGYTAKTSPFAPEQTGWQPMYPETTGYIIETFLRYAKLSGDEDCRTRARHMVDWELRVQLPDGGIQGGTHGAKPVASSTFVTGQVIFGWLAAHKAFGLDAYLDAGRRAGDFLLSCLDADGKFVRGYSHFASAGFRSYEARTAWALAELGQATREGKYSEAARGICNNAIRLQRKNGWFDDCDLTDNSVPLTHTIGYVTEGLLETGKILGEPSYIESARRCLAAIASVVPDDGFLPGRWSSEWKAAVPWSCLTGSAQIASVGLRFHHRFGAKDLEAAGQKLLRSVTGTQLNEGYHPGLLGGIHGSYPLDGAYICFSAPNWASKFYCDAVMDLLYPETSGSRD
jgi:hypothetical protein